MRYKIGAIMNTKIFSSIIIILLFVIACDSIFSSDDEQKAKIAINSKVINPGKEYVLTAYFPNLPNAELFLWECDKGFFTLNTDQKITNWVAPKERTVCLIKCKAYYQTNEKEVLIDLLTENKAPVLKNTRAYFEHSIIFVNTEIWDEDNVPTDGYYSFDYDSTLICQSSGKMVNDDYGFVYLSFLVPRDENYNLITGDYRINLRIYDFVDTLDNTYIVNVPARNP